MVSFDVTLPGKAQRLFQLLLDFGKGAAHAVTIEFAVYAHQKIERSV
jgi:hypothetical protein